MKDYCNGCNNRIQVGKAYIKKDINSAWYVIIRIVDNNVYYRKVPVNNLPYEKNVDPDMVFIMPIDSFKYGFVFVSTLFCPYEINHERIN